ncbi:MAG: hypothetical protein ACOX8S_01230 [Christensenellales bacterium]|jgi:hypothetical protein
MTIQAVTANSLLSFDSAVRGARDHRRRARRRSCLWDFDRESAGYDRILELMQGVHATVHKAANIDVGEFKTKVFISNIEDKHNLLGEGTDMAHDGDCFNKVMLIVLS